MLAGDILKTDWIKDIPKADIVIVIAEGLLMYFSKEQVRTILHNITGSFGRGVLLAEIMHPKMMSEKLHDAVKHTTEKLGWRPETGKEQLQRDPGRSLLKESSFWDEMKKDTLVGKIGSVIAKNLNNRLAVYRWGK